MMTRIVIPWDTHRGRIKKFCLLKRVNGAVYTEPTPYRFIWEYDEDNNLVVKYDRTNYPEDPRQEFTITFE